MLASTKVIEYSTSGVRHHTYKCDYNYATVDNGEFPQPIRIEIAGKM